MPVLHGTISSAGFHSNSFFFCELVYGYKIIPFFDKLWNNDFSSVHGGFENIVHENNCTVFCGRHNRIYVPHDFCTSSVSQSSVSTDQSIMGVPTVERTLSLIEP